MRIRLHYVAPMQGFDPRCQWLGTVEDDGGSGKLLLGPTGLYVKVVRGHGVPLDQDEVTMALADAMGRPRGRAADPAGKLERSTVLLSAEDTQRARSIGQGNLSAGLRTAVRAYKGD